MATLGKVTLIAVLVASLAVLILCGFLLWDFSQGQHPLDKPAGEIEVLVVLLLASCGLYTIVFVLSSLISATSFARQADRSIATIRAQIGVAMNDLRALKEDARKLVHEKPQFDGETAQAAPQAESVERHLTVIAQRIADWNGTALDPQVKLELMHYESAAVYLELTGRPNVAPSLAALYRRFADLYAASDKVRQRFYLTRALSFTPPDSQSGPELHYDLACWFADNRDFSHALGELTLAFQHQSKALDDRLAQDIEEGGRLYQLASTPPFEKALNDLLLKMSIGIG